MIKPIRVFLCLLIGILFFAFSSHAQFVNFEETWQEFLSNNKISNISELTKPSKESKIDYVKYSLMYANTNFCAGDIGDAESFMKEVRAIGSGVFNTIPGFKEKYEDLDVKMKAYHKVENLWLNFIKYRNVTLAQLEEVAEAKMVCEKGTLAKYFHMVAYAHYCNGNIAEAKSNFEGRVLKLAEKTSLKVSDINGLEEEVKTFKALFPALAKLGKAWKTFTTTDVSNGFDTKLPLIECYPMPSMKAYILVAANDVCRKGAQMLEQVNKLQANNPHELDASLKEKINWLETEVGKYNGDLASLEKAWTEFVPTDTVASGTPFDFEYCHKAAQIKVCAMKGVMYYCEMGKEMLDKIGTIRKEHNPELDATILQKIKTLEDKLQQSQDDFDNLEKQWTEFVASNDTLLNGFQLATYYCDKIAQIKSWTIRGHFDACAKGQDFLDEIDVYLDVHKLKMDEELTCRVRRLRQKVWDCRYWELVLQARKETHAEREEFGPESALIMQGDLNSEEQPCETTVEYTALGNIGIKYVISTYLCQNIDLAKMGDPEYYKKIADWVDTEVLQKYCEESMRCKEDFFIYLEGHTDGHAFIGVSYKKSLDIPAGTEYTHYIDGEAIEKTIERDITSKLRSNMELGIARAWTVKDQLDFMQVPITIGAYEHPKDEKGGEYRKIDIELNITNLLLDFYEKRLAELVAASGIGERPEDC